MADLSNCQWCRNPLQFHQHAEDCPDGCHMLYCDNCEYVIDVYGADPDNETTSLEELRGRIVRYLGQRAEIAGVLADLQKIIDTPQGTRVYPGIVCRGSITLGTACGQCARCEDERKRQRYEDKS